MNVREHIAAGLTPREALMAAVQKWGKDRPAPQIGQKQFRPVRSQIRSIDEEARTIEFVASTEVVDRYGDIIRVDGWELANYELNPVFLWAHESDKPPIGKCVGIAIEKKELVQKIQFATKDEYPFADTVFKLYKGGYLRAVSVGFMALEKPKPRIDEETGEWLGYEFTRQELFELSAVPVPANPEALGRAVCKGVISAGERKEFAAAMRRFVVEMRALCGDTLPWAYMVPGVTFTESVKEEKPGVETDKARKPNPYGSLGVDEAAYQDCPKGEDCPKEGDDPCPAEDCPNKGKAARPSEQLKAFCDEGRELAQKIDRRLGSIETALWDIQEDLKILKQRDEKSLSLSVGIDTIEDGGASPKTAPDAAPDPNAGKRIIGNVEQLLDVLVVKSR